jgi:hypothetical protein
MISFFEAFPEAAMEPPFAILYLRMRSSQGCLRASSAEVRLL